MSVPTILYHTQNSWILPLDPHISARSMDSCMKYGSTDCAARSMDCADPQIAPNIRTRIWQTPYFYQLNGEILQSIPNTPYLGVTLSTDLIFNIHLTKNVAKSYQCLPFARCNLKYCYISLIRSKLEYSSSVWDPHLRKDIHQLEIVHRRAARFIKGDYSYDSIVSQMLLKRSRPIILGKQKKMNKLTSILLK